MTDTLTTTEAAARLGVTEPTIRRYCRQGLVDATLHNAAWHIDAASVDGASILARIQERKAADYTPPPKPVTKATNGSAPRFVSQPQKAPKTWDANWTASRPDGCTVSDAQLAANRRAVAAQMRAHRDGRVRAVVLDRNGNRIGEV